VNGCLAKVGFKPEALRCIIFDVDGTLYRQPPVRRAMAFRLLSYAIANPLAGLKTAKFLRRYRRAQEQLRGAGGGAGQLETACRQTGVEPEWGAGCVREWIERRPLDLVAKAIYPGLASLLTRAAEREIKLAVVSDYPAQEKLRALGLDRYFICVLSPADPRMGRLKPHPSGILAVLRELKIDSSAAVYIGDRPEVDAEAARRAGVACIIVGRAAGPSSGEWVGARDYFQLGAMLGLVEKTRIREVIAR
jgi:beta-phosphoglucomutase-like phosphatase (HAD superfamily)